MIRLRMLGGLDLTHPDGQGDAHAVLVQPKRLALLVYLALAGDRRFQRRDAVVGLFWPELDAEHARGALRQALRFLRGELGADVLINRGEEEVGVNRQVVECDTWDFDGACESRRWGEALALYRGDLLAGVYIADISAEFEHWLEQERGRLRRRAASAASSAVEHAERAGDLVAAAPWPGAAWSSPPTTSLRCDGSCGFSIARATGPGRWPRTRCFDCVLPPTTASSLRPRPRPCSRASGPATSASGNLP